MSHKKIMLLVLLSFFSIAAGGTFGLLDFFGFIDGRHALSITLLLLGVLFMYAISINLFILNFAHRERVMLSFIVASVFFGLTFFLMNLNIILTITASIFFFIFLYYAFDTSLKRSDMYIKFSPGDIFFPILRKGLFFLLLLLAFLAFIQSRSLVSQNTLVTPSLVRIIARPAILTLNKQLGAQLQSQLGDTFQQTIGTQEREKIVKFVLAEIVESMAEGETRQVFGFTPENISIEKTIVYENGEIDISPVIEEMLPDISTKLNVRVQEYAVIAPFVIALFVIIFLQFFLFPIQLVESFLTIIIFKLLIATNFILVNKEMKEVERLRLY